MIELQNPDGNFRVETPEAWPASLPGAEPKASGWAPLYLRLSEYFTVGGVLEIPLKLSQRVLSFANTKMRDVYRQSLSIDHKQMSAVETV